MIKKLKYIIDTIKTYNERVRLSNELKNYISKIQGIYIVIPLGISRFNNNFQYIINNPYPLIVEGMNARVKIREMSYYLRVKVMPGYTLSLKNLIITYEPYSADIDHFLILKKIQGEY